MTSRLARRAIAAAPNAFWTTQRVRLALRLAVFLSDLALINVAFALAYVMRYQWEWFRPIAFDAPLSAYLPIQLLFNAALLVFFVFDGVLQSARGRLARSDVDTDRQRDQGGVHCLGGDLHLRPSRVFAADDP